MQKKLGCRAKRAARAHFWELSGVVRLDLTSVQYCSLFVYYRCLLQLSSRGGCYSCRLELSAADGYSIVRFWMFFRFLWDPRDAKKLGCRAKRAARAHFWELSGIVRLDVSAVQYCSPFLYYQWLLQVSSAGGCYSCRLESNTNS